MRNVKLLKALKVVKTLDRTDTIRLDREDPEIDQCGEALFFFSFPSPRLLSAD